MIASPPPIAVSNSIVVTREFFDGAGKSVVAEIKFAISGPRAERAFRQLANKAMRKRDRTTKLIDGLVEVKVSEAR